MKKTFSIVLINAVFIFLYAYPMNQKNPRLQQIQSEFDEKNAQRDREFVETFLAKKKLSDILLEKMEPKNANQVLIDLCKLNEAKSIQQISEFAQHHSIFFPNE